MNVTLPKPPINAGSFLYSLVAKLKEVFTKIRPASGWQDMTASMATARVGATKAPTWEAMTDGIYAFNFEDGDTKQAWLAFHMPHELAATYKDEQGNVVPARIYPHVHWSPVTGPATGTVRFGIEYTYARGYGDAAFPSSTTIYLEQTVSAAAANTHFIVETTDDNAIEDAAIETDGLMMVRVFRDGTHANDDIGVDVFITFMDLHYYSDGLLTNERNRNASGLRWTKQNPY